MLQDYPTTRSGRRCHVSGHEFAPGEAYVSAVVTRGSQLVRVDVAAANWNQPLEGTVGWWRCRMPDTGLTRLKLAPNSVLLDTLGQLLKHPENQTLAFFLALLLVRRRVLIEKEQISLSDASPQSLTNWYLESSVDGAQWCIPKVSTEAVDAKQLHESLVGLLYSEE
jgi:hypothetical protein